MKAKPCQSLVIEAPCELGAVRNAARTVRSFMESNGANTEEAGAWELVASEAGNNAVLYAPAEKQAIPVTFFVSALPERFELRVTDHTPGFDWPADRDLPDDASECGRGIFLINALTDERRYLRSETHNCLWMARQRAEPQPLPLRSSTAAELEAMLEGMAEELAGAYESLRAIFRFSSDMPEGDNEGHFAAKWLNELLRILDADWFVFRVRQPGRSSYTTLACSSLPLGVLDANEDRNNSQNPNIELRALLGRRQISFKGSELQAGDPLLQLCGTQGSGLCSPVHFGPKPSCILSVGFSHVERTLSAGKQNIAQTFATFLAIQLRNAQAQRDKVLTKLVSRDLQIASTIQKALLPRHLPSGHGFEMAAYGQSAREVGGDLYDAFAVSDKGILMIIADVMGKGVPAAMIAAMLHSVVRSRPELAHQPAQLLSFLHHSMHADLSNVGMFITAQLVYCDFSTRQLTLATAGHHPALLAAPSLLSTIRINSEGPLLGVFPDAEFEEISVPLPEGSRVLLYTDGLPELRNVKGQCFGEPMLGQSLLRLTRERLPAAELRQQLAWMIDDFQNGMPQTDDVTFILLADQLGQ